MADEVLGKVRDHQRLLASINAGRTGPGPIFIPVVSTLLDVAELVLTRMVEGEGV